MKIVHLIGYFQPEFGYKEYYIARNQVKLGHEVHIIASDKVFPFPDYSKMAHEAGAPSTRYRVAGESTIDGVKVHRLKSFFEIKDFILTSGVKKLLQKINPDIVHMHAPQQGMTVLGAAYKDNLGYFLICDDQALVDSKKTKPYSSLSGKVRYELFQKFLSSYVYKKADVIFCPNNASKSFIESSFGVSSDKVQLVPIGYDSEFYFFDNNSREEVRKEFSLEKNDFVILIAGRLNPEKGFDRILKLLVPFLESSAKMLVVGDGEAKEDLENLVRDLHLENRVKFVGFVPEKSLYKYYSASDLAIWSKPSVGISNAIGCSLPVLTPETEVFSHYNVFGGVTFDPENSEDFVKKVEKILTNKGYLEGLRKKVEKGKEALDFKNLANEDFKVYENHVKQN